VNDNCGRSINYLRLSVTELCNLRCRYCMGEEGVGKKRHEDMLTEDEMINAVKAAASLGVRKLRITGGEPLVKRNILSICARAAAVEGIDELCITTNGTLLKDMAKPLAKAGVSRVNISIDTLDAKKYEFITRRDQLADALSGIESALEAGFERVKLNAVLIGGFNEDEIAPLAYLTVKYPLDVRFIELMPMPGVSRGQSMKMLSNSAVLAALPELEAAGDDGGVARLYALPGAQGKVGLISPISRHFCAQCNRIRLTADGMLRPCLHENIEFPIKGLDYDGMVSRFKAAIMAKPERRSELSETRQSSAGREMNRIGG